MPRAAGVWTLAGDRLIIIDADGPATVVVPSERVRMLAVDLPLPSRAKRRAALPFAIEDRIADPLDSVHLALGTRIDPQDAPNRYLVGVVRRETMAEWVALAQAQGLGDAAMVPDALLLPRPGEGWAVAVRQGRALVLAADGTGFAVPAALLRAAWEAAGRPRIYNHGEPLADDMQSVAAASDTRQPGGRAALAAAELDLRQDEFAVRTRAGISSGWRRLGWIVAAGAAAHVAIAGADTVMLRRIADQRAEQTRAIVSLAAPGADLSGDLVGAVTGLLPQGSGGPPDRFMPLLVRVSAALGPVSGGVAVRALRFEGNVLTLDLAPGDAGLAERIGAALRAARISGNATASPDGAIRITASAA
ncbi:type II secretion system protein GspL [Sphingomonas sp. RS6]